MKKLFTLSISALFCMATILAQSPQKMSYQAVIHDAGGKLVTNQSIGMRISILRGSSTGNEVYHEVCNPSPQSNANGLVSIEIGGAPGFDTISWGNGPYFIKIETDPKGGSSYTITGISQLLSVPYALYAKSSGNSITQAALDLKVDKLTGKVLSTNDYTTAEQTKLASISVLSPGSAVGNTPYWNGSSWVANNSNIYNNGGGIGVGTNIPSGKLEVKSAGQVPQLVINQSDAGNFGRIRIQNLSTTTNTRYWDIAGYISNGIVADDRLNFFNSNTGDQLGLGGNGAIYFHNNAGTAGQVLQSSGTGGSPTWVNPNTNVAAPVNATDAATKAYVDALLNQLSSKGAIVVDADRNIYSTVRIGSQVWMAENLKTTSYSDGTAIPNVTVLSTWQTLVTPAYCWYNNNIQNKDTYGALYNWYTVQTGKLCPTGWHVPTDAELTTLANYLISFGFNYDGTTTGNKIAKALVSNTNWSSSVNTGSVGNVDYPSKRNATGFNAYPAGHLHNSVGMEFIETGYGSRLWSSTEETGSIYGFMWILLSSNSDFSDAKYYKGNALSVRCLKD